MSGSNSIKALFLVSGAYGHMDFGGLGFLRLSQKLEAEGHSCVWISCGDQVTRLRVHGCQVEEERLLNQLSLMQMRQIEVLEKNHALREDIIAALGRVRQRMAQHRPDVVFIDRLLVGAGLAAAQLDLPYAAIGKPRWLLALFSGPRPRAR
jgi:UDP:flavonoid glycosyltransferase YjiC (YdhE family)